MIVIFRNIIKHNLFHIPEVGTSTAVKNKEVVLVDSTLFMIEFRV